MDQLISLLRKYLANSVVFASTAHGFHWNVEGPDFSQYHLLFGEIYEEVFEALDVIAEEIRAMGSVVPGSLGRFAELSNLEDEREHVDALTMIHRLYQDNQRILENIEKAYAAAEAAGNHGFSNLMADRQSAHGKHGWKLRSTLVGILF